MTDYTPPSANNHHRQVLKDIAEFDISAGER